MNAISPIVGERRHWPPQRVDVTAIAAAAGWVWAMPEPGDRPFSIRYTRWLDLPMLAAVEVADGRPFTMADPGTPLPLVVGPIRVDLARRVVLTATGQRIRLTGAQFALLAELVNARGQMRSQSELTEAVFGRRWYSDDQGVKELVFNLRRKLPPDEDGQPLIQTVRCAGYWMRAPSEAAP